MAGAIFGDWTHRRGDAGGSRALGADLAHARFRVAWTWEAPGGARIDQVRTSGEFVFVAVMGVSDDAPGWDHATIFALDAASGRVIARRTLPDPVPVASLVIEGRVLRAVATGPDEPVFAYSLTIPELAPVHRFTVALEDARRADVLDAWALLGGGLWLELEGGEGTAVYVSVTDPDDAGEPSRPAGHARSAGNAGGIPPRPPSSSNIVLPVEIHVDTVSSARDACESERALFVPADGGTPDSRRENVERPPPQEGGLSTLLFKLEPEKEGPSGGRVRPRRTVCARADTHGIACQTHAVAHEGLVYAALAGRAPKELVAQVIAVDRSTFVERWKTPLSRFPSSYSGSRGAELARLAYVNGEIAIQKLGADGTPSSELLVAGPSGSLEPVLLGAKRRFVLDAALGGSLLAHDSKADGSVVVAAFSVESKGGLLGRRARMHVSVETPEVGGAVAVYAGAGKILVKGERRLVAIGI